MIIARYIDVKDGNTYFIIKDDVKGYRSMFDNYDIITDLSYFDTFKEAEKCMLVHRPSAVLYTKVDESKVDCIIDAFIDFLNDKGITKLNRDDFFDLHYELLKIYKTDYLSLHLSFKDKIADMIEAFEDLLDKNGIDIPNPEKEDAIHDGEDKDSICNVYGSDYGYLEEEIIEILSGTGRIDKEMTHFPDDSDFDVDESDVYFDDELDDFEFQPCHRR